MDERERLPRAKSAGSSCTSSPMSPPPCELAEVDNDVPERCPTCAASSSTSSGSCCASRGAAVRFFARFAAPPVAAGRARAARARFFGLGAGCSTMRSGSKGLVDIGERGRVCARAYVRDACERGARASRVRVPKTGRGPKVSRRQLEPLAFALPRAGVRWNRFRCRRLCGRTQKNGRQGEGRERSKAGPEVKRQQSPGGGGGH